MMKKFVAVISILALLLCHVSAFAEGIDLENMDVKELAELGIAIEKELYNRGEQINGVLWPGTYIVGKDIEPGVYLFTSIEVDDAMNYAGGFIFSAEGVYEGSQLLAVSEGEIERIRLEEENNILISYGICCIEKIQ